MMSKKFYSFLAALAVACSCAAAHAQVTVLGDFEGGSLDGWVGVSDSGGDGAGNTTPTLSTLANATVASTGLAALRVENTNDAHNFWAISLNDTNYPGLAAKIAQHNAGSLKADVTFVASVFNDPEGNWGQWNKIAVQTTASGWTEANSVADPGWNAGQGNLRYTYEWPLAAINPNAGTFANIILSINYARAEYGAANHPDFYIDNIRLEGVPEPTSLGLAGLAIAGLAARRRRS